MTIDFGYVYREDGRPRRPRVGRYGEEWSGWRLCCELPHGYREIAHLTSGGDWRTTRELAQAAGVSQSQVRRTLNRLVKLGMVRRESRLGGAGGTRLVWLITPPI